MISACKSSTLPNLPFHCPFLSARRETTFSRPPIGWKSFRDRPEAPETPPKLFGLDQNKTKQKSTQKTRNGRLEKEKSITHCTARSGKWRERSVSQKKRKKEVKGFVSGVQLQQEGEWGAAVRKGPMVFLFGVSLLQNKTPHRAEKRNNTQCETV